jgi:hypothetical protein
MTCGTWWPILRQRPLMVQATTRKDSRRRRPQTGSACQAVSESIEDSG